MDDLIAEQKIQLRKECRAARKALGEMGRARASLAICKRLAAWTMFTASETILTYMPIKSEVDLTPLLERFPQKRWVLPRIRPEENHRMDFHRYDAARLIQHPFGMMEPTPDAPTLAADEIELTLVPGLAYDRRGYRLGYGGGYYDRFLSRFRGLSAGIVFHDLWLDLIPHGAHDVTVQWVVTEQDIFGIKK
ncbi:MAG: 5-formyltetrahydrofolate cyclo-ligase [Chloroflexi bacterium]|nr:5-formyltetrahydrofolate cyclo-ligase [Chloroflexota bacterium]